MGENIVGEEIVFDGDKLLDRILNMVKSDEELPSESEDHSMETCFRMKNELANMRKNFEMEVSNEQENLKRANEEMRLMAEEVKKGKEECNREVLQLHEKLKEVKRRNCELNQKLKEGNERKCNNERNLVDLTDKMSKVDKMEAVRQRMEDFAEERRKLKLEIEAQKTTIANLNVQHDESQSIINELRVELQKKEEISDKQNTEIMKLRVCLSNEISNRKCVQEKNEKLQNSWTKMRQDYFDMDRDLRCSSPPPQQQDLVSAAPPVKVEENLHEISLSEDCALRGSDDHTPSNSHKRKLSDSERIDTSDENGETMSYPRTKRCLKFKESQTNQEDGSGHFAVIGEGEREGGGDHPSGVTVAVVSEEPRPCGSKYKLRKRM